MRPLDYSIDATRPGSRELSVTLEFDLADGPRPPLPEEEGRQSLQLFLPTWTPGSYLIREYARHLSRVQASDAATGHAIPCRKLRKNRFELGPCPSTRRVRITYAVYAHELSVRTADVTSDHAFWNHACLLLWPVGDAQRGARITVRHLEGWSLACGLPKAEASGESGNDGGTRQTTLVARDMDHAMDSPCLVGRFERLDWRVAGVPHALVLDGLAGIKAPANLLTDLTTIIDSARTVFGGALPYEHYLFLCLFTNEAHGGLEHAESTTLLMSRTALASEKGYREFLALAAHELFHAWNVKRMRPAELWRYDYENENYTSLLWLIEGWTAYYDDLLCLRSGILTQEDYLGILAKSINSMLTGPGRHRLSLSDSSFDAWIRLYRPDENTRNSSQNYYVNGSVAALCLDLCVRRESGGAKSLDDVIRGLYEDTYGQGRGYTIDDVERILRLLAGEVAVALLDALVAKELDPDLSTALATVGIRIVTRDADRPHLGVTFEPGGTTVAAVTLDSPAHAAGIAPGDEVLAIAGLRTDAARWSDVFQATAKIDTPLEILVSRRGVIARCSVIPCRSPGTVSLDLEPAPNAQQLNLRNAWLGRTAKETTT